MQAMNKENGKENPSFMRPKPGVLGFLPKENNDREIETVYHTIAAEGRANFKFVRI